MSEFRSAVLCAAAALDREWARTEDVGFRYSSVQMARVAVEALEADGWVRTAGPDPGVNTKAVREMLRPGDVMDDIGNGAASVIRKLCDEVDRLRNHVVPLSDTQHEEGEQP